MMETFLWALLTAAVVAVVEAIVKDVYTTLRGGAAARRAAVGAAV